MRLGVYVGSFNPPHNGHLKVANYLIENRIVDKVLMLPTPDYWDKHLVDISKRVEMLRLLETEDIIVDDVHNVYKYTYQVLRSLQEDYKSDELYLIIGSDNLEKLHTWANIDEILGYHIIVLRRGDTDIDRYLANFDQSRFVVINDFPFIDISSTEIRANLNNDNLDAKVLNFIRKNNLYAK